MDSDLIRDMCGNLSRMKWSDDSNSLIRIMDSLEMPQVVKTVQSNTLDIRENEYMLLHSVYDRYLLLGLTPGGESTPGATVTEFFLIPDWHRAQCKIKSANPRVQSGSIIRTGIYRKISMM